MRIKETEEGVIMAALDEISSGHHGSAANARAMKALVAQHENDRDE